MASANTPAASPVEYAHEQGWGLNEEERTRQPPPEASSLLTRSADYQYGSQDFGDPAALTARATPARAATVKLIAASIRSPTKWRATLQCPRHDTLRQNP